MTQLAERFRIRLWLAGLTSADVGPLLGLTRDRASALIGDRGAFVDQPELRAKLRDALEQGPDLQHVYSALATAALVPGRAGRDVRWTRIVLHIPLRAWSSDLGYSTCWWSEFERDETVATAALAGGRLTSRSRREIKKHMKCAAAMLVRLFPSIEERRGLSDVS